MSEERTEHEERPARVDRIPLLRPTLVMSALLLVVCCVVYPLAITAVAQGAMKSRADGSLVERNGRVVGSALIGQSIGDWAAHPEYLWGRPSAASNDAATNVTVSSGSNYGPLHAPLIEEVAARVKLLRESGVTGPIPVDLVTKSASGLDPDLSVAAARLQIARIAKARKLDPAVVEAIIARATERPYGGVFGSAKVNVLAVNVELDATSAVATAMSSDPVH
jgi:K+-transporting ATPase ATPase C chain